MTKQEAIQAMKEGYKVAHKYFTPHEWVMQSRRYRDVYETEEGYDVTEKEFWAFRDSEAFEKDWIIWTDPASPEPATVKEDLAGVIAKEALEQTKPI